MTAIDRIDYRTPTLVDEDLLVEMRPAGHVLGSAMARVTTGGQSLLYTGDFKLRPSLTVEQADPVPSDYLLMESTYGLPMFRFPDWRLVHEQLAERVSAALKAGSQPIVMGYSLGKAQEIVRILTDHGFPVTCHGAVFAINQLYERHDVSLGSYRRYAADDFHGPKAIDLAERGVLVAPPQVARSAFVSRFKSATTLLLSGWGLLKNAKFRYGVDQVLPVSDHADFNELLELIERVSPKHVYTHHGYKEFVDTLVHRGIKATLARPQAQLQLFD